MNFFPTVLGATGAAGQANGDGLIQATTGTTTVCPDSTCVDGEAAVFWTELNLAGLISDPISGNTFTAPPTNVLDTTVPASKLGKGGRVSIGTLNGRNYYLIAGMSGAITSGVPTIAPGVTTIDAFNIDTKMDDGVPTTGKVISVDTATPVANVPANTAGGASACGSSATVYNNALYADTVNCNISIRTSF